MSKADREAPIAVIADNGRLIPADGWAQEDLLKLPNGVRFNAYLKIAVSNVDDLHGQLLKKYMAGITQLFDWLPNTGPGTNFPTANHLRRYILKELSFCETWPQADGSIRKEAHSMARDKMSFADLQVCMELTRAYVLAYTEAVGSESYDPWEAWELAHPKPGFAQ